MKEEVWTFVLDSQERLQELPSESFRKLIEIEDSQALPELSGRTVRVAVVHLRHVKGRPRKVGAIEFRRVKVTPEGSLDPNFRERRKRMNAELASIKPQPHDSSRVVDASRRFKERRFYNEFSWTPSVSMVQQISALIQDKTRGVLETREVMYQILSLTATA